MLKYNKVKGQAMAAAPLAVVVVWAWNAYFPETQMPAEVGGALGAVIGPLAAWIVSWAPTPGDPS